MLFAVGPGGIPATPEQIDMKAPFVYLEMLAGPSVAGILLTGLASGKVGLRELLALVLRWGVDVRWYAIALMATPLFAMATLFALLPTSRSFFPAYSHATTRRPYCCLVSR